MIYPKQTLAQCVVQLCKVREVKHIVISPGSRNAPLIIGFTNNPFFKCYSIVDERSAGFFALGIAQQTSEAVAVVCTSGSALLNYYPAVAEAFYTGIPLVVISADRPENLINIGDGQTIIQPNAFGAHVLFEANLKIPKKRYFSSFKSTEIKAQRLILKALDTGLNKMGPVHINVPFEEPLYETVTALDFQQISTKNLKTIAAIKLSASNLRTWQKAKRKLVLVGVNKPNTIDAEMIQKLANDPSVIVLTETTSNLHHPRFFPFIDQLITPLDPVGLKALQPDILLTFGGLIISKRIKAFLRTYKPKYHWHVDPNNANDTFFSLSKHFKCNSNIFLNQLYKSIALTPSTYFEFWQAVKYKRLKAHQSYLSTIPFCDFKAFELISTAIPKSYMVQSANSSVIRYLQLFEFDSSITLFCNRGTSGIDGSTSTAVGAAVVSELPTLLISGDLSFFYDANGLWNKYIPNNFKMIIINNDGGGIFRILPGNDDSKLFRTYFETKHGRSAEGLAKDFRFDYHTANSVDSLSKALPVFFKASNSPQLLEVFTPSEDNSKILLAYFDALK